MAFSIRILALLLFTLLTASCPRVWALDPKDVLTFSVGPVSVRPQLGLSEVYNDNIFYLAEDPESDFISSISPGLKLQLGRVEENYLWLNYTLEQLLYAENRDLDALRHYLRARARATASAAKP